MRRKLNSFRNDTKNQNAIFSKVIELDPIVLEKQKRDRECHYLEWIQKFNYKLTMYKHHLLSTYLEKTILKMEEEKEMMISIEKRTRNLFDLEPHLKSDILDKIKKEKSDSNDPELDYTKVENKSISKENNKTNESDSNDSKFCLGVSIDTETEEVFNDDMVDAKSVVINSDVNEKSNSNVSDNDMILDYAVNEKYVVLDYDGLIVKEKKIDSDKKRGKNH